MEMDSVTAITKALELIEYLSDGKVVKLQTAAGILRVPLEETRRIAQVLDEKGVLIQQYYQQTVQLKRQILLQPAGSTDRFFAGTPKGIDADTLQRIIKIVSARTTECTSQEMGELMGVTRVTARRYLEYMAAKGMLQRRKIYNNIGRPATKYMWREEYRSISIPLNEKRSAI